MLPKAKTIAQWTLDFVALQDAWTDFILSRQAKLCTPGTIAFYQLTAGKFIQWLVTQGVTTPDQVTARHVRAYLAQLAVSPRTIANDARAIRVLVRFWYAEKYLSQPITFDIPKVDKKRLPMLDADSLAHVLDVCNVREKAIVMTMADTGIRQAELRGLSWGDIDIQNGLIRIERGKGGKARSTVAGAVTRRALLAYRRTLESHGDTDPVFQKQYGKSFTSRGMVRLFERISKKAGVYVRPHALRRTFAILSLRAGMSPLHLQALLGHSGLEMVRHYAQMVEDDLLSAHKTASPIDHLARLRKG